MGGQPPSAPPRQRQRRQHSPHPHPPHAHAAAQHNPAVFDVFREFGPLRLRRLARPRSAGNSPRNAASRRLPPAPGRPGSCAQIPAGRRPPAAPPALPPPAREYAWPAPWSPRRWPPQPLRALRAPAATPRRMPPLRPLAPCSSPKPSRSNHKRSQTPNQRLLALLRLPGTCLAPPPHPPSLPILNPARVTRQVSALRNLQTTPASPPVPRLLETWLGLPDWPSHHRLLDLVRLDLVRHSFHAGWTAKRMGASPIPDDLEANRGHRRFRIAGMPLSAIAFLILTAAVSLLTAHYRFISWR